MVLDEVTTVMMFADLSIFVLHIHVVKP